MKTNIIKYTSRETQEEALADEIALLLNEFIEGGKEPVLLLSGGSTPANMYSMLSEKDICWKKVNVLLVDERYVSPECNFSNEKMIREKLLKNKSSAAKFTGMIHDLTNAAENLRLLEKLYTGLDMENAIVVLGMGTDGHFASLFTGDPASISGLLPNAPLLINTKAPTEPIHRISFSAPALYKAKYVYLMITGKQKLEVLTNSEKDNLPVAYMLKNKPKMKIIYSE